MPSQKPGEHAARIEGRWCEWDGGHVGQNVLEYAFLDTNGFKQKLCRQHVDDCVRALSALTSLPFTAVGTP